MVQLLLGHADPRTTQLYARLSLGPARAEYDKAMATLASQKTSALAHTKIAPSPEIADPGGAVKGVRRWR